MENKQYLDEEKYQKNKEKLIRLALVVLILGLVIGGGLIVAGIRKYSELNRKSVQATIENTINKANKKQEIITQIAAEETKLFARKKELENKGIEYNTSTDYTDGEAYELKIITKALDPSFDHWKFSEYKNHIATKNYCSLKQELYDIESDERFEELKNQNSLGNIQSEAINVANITKAMPLFMFGAFIIIGGLMGSSFIYAIAKRREIQAFTVQQSIPVEKEKIEVMTPTYAETVKDIARAVAEGLKEGKGE